jgi:hypothetical protein
MRNEVSFTNEYCIMFGTILVFVGALLAVDIILEKRIEEAKLILEIERCDLKY